MCKSVFSGDAVCIVVPKFNLYIILLSNLLNDIDKWLSKYGLQTLEYSGDLFRGPQGRNYFCNCLGTYLPFSLC